MGEEFDVADAVERSSGWSPGDRRAVEASGRRHSDEQRRARDKQAERRLEPDESATEMRCHRHIGPDGEGMEIETVETQHPVAGYEDPGVL